MTIEVGHYVRKTHRGFLKHICQHQHEPVELEARIHAIANAARERLCWGPQSGNSVAVSATAAAAELKGWTGTPIGATWTPADDSWQLHTRDLYRVDALR